MKKILIISMKTGWGHIRAAQALEEYARDNLPEIDVKHVDLREIEPRLGKFFELFYDVANDYLPLVWGAVYQTFDKPPVSAAFRKTGGFQRVFARKISRYLKKEAPGGVIFTNVIPAPMVAPSCKKIFPNVSLAAVVTDYHGHAYYNVPLIDRYFTPAIEVKDDLVRAGVAKNRIEASGMPLGKKFYCRYNPRVIKKNLGIKNDFKTALFISRLEKEFIVPALRGILENSRPLNLIMVCGGNNGVYQKVKSEIGESDNFKLINWTGRLDEYMKIADVVVSKPGGLIISECLALGKPIVMTDPIPGQEEKNAEFISRRGYGKMALSAQEIAAAVKNELLSPSKIEKIDAGGACAKIFAAFA